MSVTWSRRGILFLTLAIFLTTLVCLQSTGLYYDSARPNRPAAQDVDNMQSGFAERPPGEERPPPAEAAVTSIAKNHDGAVKHYEEIAAQDEPPEPSEPQSPPPPTKGLVIGRKAVDEFGGGTEWVRELDDWKPFVYIVDLEPGVNSSTGYRTKMNRAHEAMPYLTYIVEHYPDFPDVTAFVHPHRGGPGAQASAWHTDSPKNDAVTMLRMLKTETVLREGYVNLRCVDKLPGCPDEIQPWRDPPDPEKTAEHVFPYYYSALFNVTLSQVREQASVVAQACCAQFAVSRDQILARPKSEYEHFVSFLENTVQDGHEDETAGRVMEYMWHIMFGKPAVHCPKAIECYCDVYGRMCPRVRPPNVV